jgi:predicted esterase
MGPHQNQKLAYAGAPPDRARAALILVHGRGDTAVKILELTRVFDVPDIAYLAPQAGGNQWYPNRFMAPVESNEPGISSGIQAIHDALEVITGAGIPLERAALLGFSQGACLTLEYAARHARRYGAVIGLSGGLIGPDGTPRDYPGSLEGTPVFLGCSDVDSHIPLARVHETDEVLARLGAVVDTRIYPGMGHTVNADEVEAVGGLLRRLPESMR